jgi:hypothetical protein
MAISKKVTKSITFPVTFFKTKTRKTLILRVLQFKEVVPTGIDLFTLVS